MRYRAVLMEADLVQTASGTDQRLRFSLLFFVAWMVTTALPRLSAGVPFATSDVLIVVPPALAAASLLMQERARYWLQLVAIPVSLILVSALCSPLALPSSLPWTLMAALSLLAYWLWVLEYVAKRRPAALQSRPMQRASILPPAKGRFWSSLALPFVGLLSACVVFVMPPLVAGPERRSFVLTMAAAFVVMAAIGGVVPMLRVEKRRADRKEVRRRALIMLAYALACLVILWGYMEYRQN